MQKTKKKGKIKQVEHLVANVQVLDGHYASRFNGVPVVALEYDPPEDAHPYVKARESMKFWLKLEAAAYKDIQEQVNKNLKEMSIWFDKTNREKLAKMLHKKG